ncbi:hypothetical protein CSA37_08630 [Candidatus Fermentibacteria bacterium]|nr:MAG: hypothetical protein CSA37_08630 [Candidatus Fermentibacteria bacterium]
MATQQELQSRIVELEGQLDELRAQAEISSSQLGYSLEESDRKFRTLFNGISIPVFVHPFSDDSFSNFIEVNDAACARYGYSREKFLKLSPSDIRVDRTKNIYSGQRAELDKNRHFVFEAFHSTCDGETFPVEISASIFTWLGQKVILCIARDMTFQAEAERSLRHSEEKFRNYIESSPNAVFIADGDGRILELNKEAVKIRNESREQLLKLKLFDLVSDLERKKAQAEFNAVKRTGRGGGTLSFERKDGTWTYWKVNAVRISSDRYIGFVSDVTDMVRAEKSASENERFIASLLKAVPTPVFFQDSQGRYSGCNQAYTRMTGKSSEDIKGKTVFQVWPSEIAERYHTKDQELINGKKHVEHEEVLLDSDGKTRSVLLSRDVIRDEFGMVTGLIGAFRDITERKLYEETLKANEQQLRLLVDNSFDVIWTLDMNMVFTYASPAIYEQTGFTPEEWVGTSLEEHCSQSSFKKLKAWAGLTAGGHENFRHMTFEMPFLRKNGEEFNAEVTVKFVMDDSGSPIGFQGTTRDVTQRRMAEEALRETGAYLEYLFNNVPAGILVIDRNTRKIFDANRYTCELIGLTKEEIVDRDCNDFISASKDNYYLNNDLIGGISRDEVMLRAADNSVIPIHKTVISAKLKQKIIILSYSLIFQNRKGPKKKIGNWSSSCCSLRKWNP